LHLVKTFFFWGGGFILVLVFVLLSLSFVFVCVAFCFQLLFQNIPRNFFFFSGLNYINKKK